MASMEINVNESKQKKKMIWSKNCQSRIAPNKVNNSNSQKSLNIQLSPVARLINNKNIKTKTKIDTRTKNIS